MKIVIEILCTTAEPSARNVAAIKETYITLCNELQQNKSLIHKYDFYFYYADPDSSCDNKVIPDKKYSNCYNIPIHCKESIYNTYEKGIIALQQTDGYDWYIRTNISSYLNIRVLDILMEQFDENIIYGNALNTYIDSEKYCNDIYVRGDLMIFSAKVKNGILDVSEKYMNYNELPVKIASVPHVDDCMFGLCVMDYFGGEYYNHLKMMKYNYIPEPNHIITKSIFYKCIGNRVKTIPPNISYSGYSWDDNEYRKFDVDKMYFLNNLYKQFNYTDILLSDIITNQRNVIFTHRTTLNISEVKKYLELKEKRAN